MTVNHSRSFPYQYSILDPTGNITALVESPVAICRQPEAAGALMQLHPEVEQVGFVRFYKVGETGADPAGDAFGRDGIAGELRMAGGEFCGNASMCAAVLCHLRRQEEGCRSGQKPGDEISCMDMPVIRLQVSGADRPVEVDLSCKPDGSFRAVLEMPPALDITEDALQLSSLSGQLPVVRMEGISHVIIEENTVFYSLLRDKDMAEAAVREWCGTLRADGLGLMFLESTGDRYKMTPLVYIPGSGTLFWEHSCASGSAAAGMYLARKYGRTVSAELWEPGGILRTESDPESGTTKLEGTVRVVGHSRET